MWLKFGVAPDGQLVCVEDVGSGKTELKCPYCYGKLTAKKGKVKQHHFAHSSATCLPVANRDFPILPLYDNFDIYLSRKDLAQLISFSTLFLHSENSQPSIICLLGVKSAKQS